MASIDQKGPTETKNFAEDVAKLYADDGKVDGAEIELLNEKYIKDDSSSKGVVVSDEVMKKCVLKDEYAAKNEGKIDTAEEIAAVVADINYDGKADGMIGVVVSDEVMNKCVLKDEYAAYSTKLFSEDFIDMVKKEIGSMPQDLVEQKK